MSSNLSVKARAPAGLTLIDHEEQGFPAAIPCEDTGELVSAQWIGALSRMRSLPLFAASRGQSEQRGEKMPWLRSTVFFLYSFQSDRR